MMTRTTLGLLALLLAAAPLAQATTMDLQLQYVGSWRISDQASLGMLNLDSAINRNPDYAHKFDVLMTLTGAGTDENFDFVLFNVGVSNVDRLAADIGFGGSKVSKNWKGSAPVIEGTGVPWEFNQDGGTSATDLVGIFVNASSLHAYYGQPGEAAGLDDGLGSPSTRLGSFGVTMTSMGAGSISVAPIQGTWYGTQINPDESSLAPINGTEPGTFNGFQFGVIPEPASLGLLCLGLVSVFSRSLGRRSR